MKLLVSIFILTLISACSTTSENEQKVPIANHGHWTLDFFYFYKSKQTHRDTFHYEGRRDCFEAMYQMQVEARKQPEHSGSGVCTKWFAEGQERTQNDLLGYR